VTIYLFEEHFTYTYWEFCASQNFIITHTYKYTFSMQCLKKNRRQIYSWNLFALLTHVRIVAVVPRSGIFWRFPKAVILKKQYCPKKLPNPAQSFLLTFILDVRILFRPWHRLSWLRCPSVFPDECRAYDRFIFLRSSLSFLHIVKWEWLDTGSGLIIGSTELLWLNYR
jgi:hypothetical protein